MKVIKKEKIKVRERMRKKKESNIIVDVKNKLIVRLN
jgi:hypothetical protein